MKTLIIYSSTNGATANVAGLIWSRMDKKHTRVSNVLDVHGNELKKYETIILGSSIYSGEIQPTMQSFYERNYDVLVQKRLALFLCCIHEGEKAQIQFENAYPEELRFRAISTHVLGGAINPRNLNFWCKLKFKRNFGYLRDLYTIKHESIQQLVREVSIDRAWKI